MRFGVCFDLAKAELIQNLGFDYIEGHVTKIAAMSDEEFDALCEQLSKLKIKVEACCVLFPGSLRLTGPDADLKAVSDYLDRAFARLERLGTQTVVFGSGGARKIPEDFDRAAAWHQMIEVGRLLAQKAQAHRLTVVIEPLNTSETNMINYQVEGIRLAEDVERPNFMVLSDFYHLWLGGEGEAEVAACGNRLRHTHIANPKGRICPAEGDDVDYGGFFSGFAKAGYNGRMSIECKIDDPEKQLPVSLALLKGLAAKHGV